MAGTLSNIRGCEEADMYPRDLLFRGAPDRLYRLREYARRWNVDPRKRTTIDWHDARRFGQARINPTAHGLYRKPGADSVCVESSIVDGFRDCGAAHEIITLQYAGWYTDADAGEMYIGHVWQLPGRDGEPCYLAGYLSSDGDGYVVMDANSTTGEPRLYWDRGDAARAADALAERDAERERDYNERWNEARRLADDADDAAQEFRRNRRIMRLARVRGDVEILEHSRDEARSAIATIRAARERIAELGVQL